MNPDLMITFIILIITTLFFIFGKFRTDFVALGSLLALILTDIITTGEALAGFSNSVVIMIAGLFVVGAGIFSTGLAKIVGIQLLKLAGKSETRLLIIVMVVTAFFSSIISNTGTVAIFLPIVMTLAFEMKVSPSRFLIPLAYASSLGGVLTLIGTPPNLVISQALGDHGFEKLSFFDFTLIGLIVFSIGLVYILTIGKRLIPNHLSTNRTADKPISTKELVGFYHIPEQLYKIRVLPQSPIVNQSLGSLNIRKKYGLLVIEIERKTKHSIHVFGHILYKEAMAESLLEKNDMLLVLGSHENVNLFVEDEHLEITDDKGDTDQLTTRQLGLTEILINPHSTFINRTIDELCFREKYKLNILAINRKGHYLKNDLTDVKLRFGDALLVHGKWSDIELMGNDSNDIVAIGQIEEKASQAFTKGKAPIAAFNLLVMVILMVFAIVPSVIAVFISAFLMVITGCLRSMNDAYRKINWESVILIAAMLPMSTALEKTGGVSLISDVMISSLGLYGPYAILAGFYVVTMTLSQFISNTATAVILAPVAITTAAALAVSPYPLLLSISIAASMAFATPVATPPNALVMSAGGYSFKDFVKVGVPLQIILAIAMIIFIPLLFPFN